MEITVKVYGSGIGILIDLDGEELASIVCLDKKEANTVIANQLAHCAKLGVRTSVVWEAYI